jgi:hypothetical protein
MADKANLILSNTELTIVQDTHFILTKHKIINIVFEIFNEQTAFIQNAIADNITSLPLEVVSAVPKIYKGDNYLQLPYVIMDYPAVFSKQAVFAIRTMFWWGNFISVTLHLSGKYKNNFAAIFFKNLKKSTGNFYYCINNNQWQHHFNADNYVAATTIPDLDSAEFKKKSFLKLALKYNLNEWNSMPQLLEAAYKHILLLLKN